jgi:hypothetical protein
MRFCSIVYAGEPESHSKPIDFSLCFVDGACVLLIAPFYGRSLVTYNLFQPCTITARYMYLSVKKSQQQLLHNYAESSSINMKS